MKAVIFAVIALMFCANVRAEECEVNLTPNVNYQDLNVVLNCLNKKIMSLEKEVRSLKDLQVTDSGQMKPKTLFENQLVSIYDCNLSRDAKFVHLSLTILNKTSSDILLSILHDSAIITDSKGLSFNSYVDIKGMHNTFATVTDKNNYTVLTPGMPTPVGFNVPAEKLTGNRVNFGFTLLYLVKDKVQQYNIALRNLLLEND